METQVLNGAPYKDDIFSTIKDKISALASQGEKLPGITFIAPVGHEPLMKYTIGLHEQAARGLGFVVNTEIVPSDTTEEQLFGIVDRLNADESVHAIVLLQPMPKQLNAIRIINRITPEKEVEGFHEKHLITMLQKEYNKIRYPMVLPTALDELFSRAGIVKKENTDWLFVADDEFFTRPFTNMVVKTACPQVVPDNCSFTIVNKGSTQFIDHCKRADFLFVVSKCPGYIQPEWLKPGVCIVDVYSNLVNEIPSTKHPGMMIPVIRGGVNPDTVNNVAGIIAPCPGGLMPLVLAILFSNALKAFNLKLAGE
jgi:methylenetetrahydrofolate dehydrogenase (NADP+) / methenyltetrahydrofolate cyclohydrolase